MNDHNLLSPAVTTHGFLSAGQSQNTKTESQDGRLQRTLDGPDGVIVAEGPEGLLDEFAASLEREKKRRARWPQDYRLAMTQLAKLFPTMQGVPGTDPWNVERLIAWLNTGAPTSGSWHAAMFLLGVWNPHTKWNQEGVKMRKGASGKFDLFAAFAAWDQNHIQAMQEWIAAPFWP
jgi:hypothetical protein